MRTPIVMVMFAALTAATATAHAEGTVLAVDGEDVFVDLGARDGVGAGSELTLLHVVIATDPVTGERLRDRFPIGTLTVVKSGDQVSLVRAPADLLQRIREGDAVVLADAPRELVDPWAVHIENEREQLRLRARPEKDPARERAAERRRAETRVAAAGVVREAWATTLGRPPAERIVIWQELLREHPDNVHAPRVEAEIRRLRQQVNAVERLAVESTDPGLDRNRRRAARLRALASNDVLLGDWLAVRPPARAHEGTPVPLTFVVLRPDETERALLYHRSAEDEGYRRVPLVPDGDQYLRGVIPAAAVRPGTLSWFVEVTDEPEAPPRAAIGSEAAPRQIDVDARVEEPTPERDGRSRVTVFLDYVDFDGGFDDGYDQYVQGEIDFMYRFYRPVYAVRVGFGTMGGIGGPKDIIDASDACRDRAGNFRCRRVTFNYAYTEIEYRYSPVIAFMLRPQFGFGAIDRAPDTDVDRCFGPDTDGCDIFSSLGMRARLRLGAEEDTNLTLGVGVTENVGTLFEAAFTWDVMPVFPVVLSAQVTDQPVPEDFGVRLIADVGWRALDWVYPSLRLAYQARDVDHAGFSGGVAANFDW